MARGAGGELTSSRKEVSSKSALVRDGRKEREDSQRGGEAGRRINRSNEKTRCWPLRVVSTRGGWSRVSRLFREAERSGHRQHRGASGGAKLTPPRARDVSNAAASNAAASSARDGAARRGARDGARDGAGEAGELSHAAALVRNPSSGGWLRYPDDPGVVRASRRQHNNDLHARAESRRTRSAEPVRRAAESASERWRWDAEQCEWRWEGVGEIGQGARALDRSARRFRARGSDHDKRTRPRI